MPKTRKVSGRKVRRGKSRKMRMLRHTRRGGNGGSNFRTLSAKNYANENASDIVNKPRTFSLPNPSLTVRSPSWPPPNNQNQASDPGTPSTPTPNAPAYGPTGRTPPFLLRKEAKKKRNNFLSGLTEEYRSPIQQAQNARKAAQPPPPPRTLWNKTRNAVTPGLGAQKLQNMTRRFVQRLTPSNTRKQGLRKMRNNAVFAMTPGPRAAAALKAITPSKQGLYNKVTLVRNGAGAFFNGLIAAGTGT